MDTDGDNKSEKLRNTLYTNREICVASSEKYISEDRCSSMDTDGDNKSTQAQKLPPRASHLSPALSPSSLKTSSDSASEIIHLQ